MVRVFGIEAAVVVDGLHPQPGALGKGHRVCQEVVFLPVVVPAGDVEQHLGSLAGFGDGEADGFAQQVHVGHEHVQGAVIGEVNLSGHLVGGMVGGDGQEGAANRHHLERAGDFLIGFGEVEAQAGAVFLGLAGAVVMHLHDHIGFRG